MTGRIAFEASEYQADGSIARTPYELEGAPDAGWEIRRAGAVHVRLGPGYRVLRTSHCGICATDLARRHLPFRLPQVTGHEVVALDDDATPVVVEINASHAARAVASDCAYCASGLPSHCPERLVLGIHDLPGGFGPWLLAPTAAVLPLPAAVTPRLATFVEPFAAALHAVRVVTRMPRRRIAVLGPRRLGTLIVAALAAWRRRTGAPYEIVALARRPELRALARRLGADDAPAQLDRDGADVVIDTTGSPAGFEQALTLARDEVHLKTTCGEPSAGLAQTTAMVVDEVALTGVAGASLVPPVGGPGFETLLVLDGTPTGVGEALAARGLRAVERSTLAASRLGAADVVAVPSLAGVDTVLRPMAGVERGLVRPRGMIVVSGGAPGCEALADAVLRCGVMVTTSRCGDFRAALDLLPEVPDLADALVTATFPAERLAEALAAAGDPKQLKVVVTQDGSAVGA
jgi:threonine dehydrogenase-like Zn-dependent dehydrogenase